MNQASEAEEKLAEALDKVQRELLEDLIDKHMTLTADLECNAFRTGVCFGARMMMEILDVDDGQNL